MAYIVMAVAQEALVPLQEANRDLPGHTHAELTRCGMDPGTTSVPAQQPCDDSEATDREDLRARLDEWLEEVRAREEARTRRPDPRRFDSSELAEFALGRGMSSAAVDEIYRAFVEARMAESEQAANAHRPSNADAGMQPWSAARTGRHELSRTKQALYNYGPTRLRPHTAMALYSYTLRSYGPT